MDLATATDCQLQILRQRVYDRHTHTVQTTGNFVSIVIKLTARMEDGHNNFSSRYTFFMHFGWNTAAIIRYRYSFIGMDSDSYFIAMPSQCFIDRVIYYLKHHMVKA